MHRVLFAVAALCLTAACQPNVPSVVETGFAGLDIVCLQGVAYYRSDLGIGYSYTPAINHDGVITRCGDESASLAQ